MELAKGYIYISPDTSGEIENVSFYPANGIPEGQNFNGYWAIGVIGEADSIWGGDGDLAIKDILMARMNTDNPISADIPNYADLFGNLFLLNSVDIDGLDLYLNLYGENSGYATDYLDLMGFSYSNILDNGFMRGLSKLFGYHPNVKVNDLSINVITHTEEGGVYDEYNQDVNVPIYLDINPDAVKVTESSISKYAGK